jgi:type IV pilus assembly protein PilM
MIYNLIKDVLIPQKISNYYLLSERFLGIDIGKVTINASLIKRNGTTVLVEKTFQEPIEADTTTPFEERVQKAIKKIIAVTGTDVIVRSSLPSSQAVFKELFLPFVDPEKIALIIRYEIEPYLPFPLQEAIVDGLITGRQAEQARVLVAAVKQEYITQHLEYFKDTGISPSAITIDLFDIYALFKLVPSYKELRGPILLADIGFNSTKVGYIVDGELLLLRTLQKGTLAWARNLAHELELPPQEALNQLIRFGFDGSSDQNYHAKIANVVNPFLDEVRFTLTSFATQLKVDAPLAHILLLGEGAELPGITASLSKEFGVPASVFDISSLIQSDSLKIANGVHIDSAHIASLATAIVSPLNEQFTLRRNQFEMPYHALFIKQFLVSILLILLIFGLLLSHFFLQKRKVQKESSKLEQQVISTLKEQGLTKGKNLQTAINESQEKVSQEEAIWFAFSSQTRFSFLKHLQVLSTVIDKDGIGLKINKLIISEKEPSSITIDGQVRDFDALKVLERELKESKLFRSIPSLQDTKFNITMELIKNGDDQ